MSIIESIILGIVQGLTEFLPISSSGHLAIAQKLFGMNETGFFLEALLHVGTLVAVCIAFRKLIVGLFKGFFSMLQPKKRQPSRTGSLPGFCASLPRSTS